MDSSGTVYTKCAGCSRAVAVHDDACHHCGKERDPSEEVKPILDDLREALLDGMPDPLAAMREQLIKNDRSEER